MPFMIAPMACSRMPKCSTRPASGSPFHILVERSFGRNDGAPSMVVLLDSARSAEPPHSSGTRSAIALMTAPDALRVATPFSSAGKVGRSSAQPSGRVRVCSRSKRATSADGLRAQASYDVCHSACAALPRSTALRVCSMTSGRHLEGLVGVEAEDLLGGGDLVVAEGGAVGLAGVLGVGRGPGDDRA